MGSHSGQFQTGQHLAAVGPALGLQAHALAEAQQQLGLEMLKVVNDFTAVAMSVPLITPDDLDQVGPGTPLKGGVIGIIGPGTGLGVSGLVPCDGRWLALAGEGGHELQ